VPMPMLWAMALQLHASNIHMRKVFFIVLFTGCRNKIESSEQEPIQQSRGNDGG
jgi:hypothetical protein